MKKLIILAFVALGSGVYGQQIALNSQYLFNEMLVNPGATGSKEYIPIQMNFRKQWAGFPGAPTTQSISAHANLGNNFGFGGTLFNDVAGPSRRSGMNINGAYHLQLDKTGDHRLGLGLGDDGGFALVVLKAGRRDRVVCCHAALRPVARVNLGCGHAR